MIYKIFSKLVTPLVGSGIGRIPFIAKLYQKLIVSLLPKDEQIVDVEGFKIKVLTGGYVNDIATELIFKKVHEPTTTKVFKDLIKLGDNVIDIGANVGYFTCLAARLVGDKGRVVAFEPGKDNVFELSNNVKLNEFNNVFIVPKAVSNNTGEADFYMSSKECARHSLIKTKEHNGKTVVQTVKLDDLLSRQRVDFIKTDTEGNELAVLMGGHITILNNPNIKLVVEVYENGLKACGVKVGELWSYLTCRLNFTHIYLVDDYKNKIELISIYPYGRKLACNLLCSRSPVDIY